MTKKKPAGDYEIGYCRPPKTTRFKKKPKQPALLDVAKLLAEPVATGVTHTATTVSYRESTSAADTGSGTIIITIITNSASLLGGGSELVAKLEMALTPSQFITRERRSAPAGTSEPAGAHLDQRIT